MSCEDSAAAPHGSRVARGAPALNGFDSLKGWGLSLLLIAEQGAGGRGLWRGDEIEALACIAIIALMLAVAVMVAL